jgi:small subunit ribosomal protein S21
MVVCSASNILCRKGGEKSMAYINVNNNESIESALRRFKRKVMTEEIIKDLKKHAHFVPPGQKAKLKSQNARKRNKKRMRPMRPMNSNQGSGPNQGSGQNQNFNR